MVWTGMSTNSRTLLEITNGNLMAIKYIDVVLETIYLYITLLD